MHGKLPFFLQVLLLKILKIFDNSFSYNSMLNKMYLLILFKYQEINFLSNLKGIDMKNYEIKAFGGFTC